MNLALTPSIKDDKHIVRSNPEDQENSENVNEVEVFDPEYDLVEEHGNRN